MILLEQLHTQYGEITITRSKQTGNHTYHQNGCYHSEINAGGVSTCAYIHVMCGIIKQSGAQDVLVLGCAGGTLATMLHRLGIRVTTVDINPYAFLLARKYFQMPQDVGCVLEDGLAYLQNPRIRHGAIAVDIFSNEGDVPQPFTTADFFRAAQQCLKAPGIIVMNMILDNDRDKKADITAAHMESAAMPSVIFDWKHSGERNIIIATDQESNIRIDTAEASETIRHTLRNMARRKPLPFPPSMLSGAML